jgi:hypothetical protein
VKLSIQQKHILKLISRDSNNEGWTSVSEALFPILSKNMPKELAIFEKQEIGGRAKLTDNGSSVVYSMQWL